MQLIKDFSDIQKLSALLLPDYQQMFLNDVNTIFAKYLDAQAKSKTQEELKNSSSVSFIENALKSSFGDDFSQEPTPVAPSSIQPPATFQNFTTMGSMPPPPSTSAFPPPPPMGSIPPPPVGQTPPPTTSRSIMAGGAFALKGNALPPKGNVKKSMSILDALGYINPYLTDMGMEASSSLATPTDVFKLLKEINGTNSLKQIYISVYQTGSLGKFLEKLYLVSRERYANFKKNAPIPTEYEVSMKLGDILVGMGFLSEQNLQMALQAQKDFANSANSTGTSWIDKTMASVQQPPSNNPAKKKFLGDTLVDFQLITKAQLELTLALQKWLKNLIFHLN